MIFQVQTLFSAVQSQRQSEVLKEQKVTRLLPFAIEGEKLVWIQSVFNQGLDPNVIIDDDGKTSLMFAAAHGKLEVVRYLLTLKGLNVLVKNRFGLDAFDLAASSCAELILNALEERAYSSDQGESDDSPLLAPRNNSRQVSCLSSQASTPDLLI